MSPLRLAFGIAVTALMCASPIWGQCGGEAGPANILVGAQQLSWRVYVVDAGTPVGFSFPCFGQTGENHWSFGDGSAVETGFQVEHVFRTLGWVRVSVSQTGDCDGSPCEFELAGAYIEIVGYMAGDPDALVILGAGAVGSWSTEIVLSNPTGDPQAGRVTMSPSSNPEAKCPRPCTSFPYDLTPFATATIVLNTESGAPSFVGAYYVIPDGSDGLPVAFARATGGSPSATAALPIFHLSSLLRGMPESLVRLGVRRSAGGDHSNLLLTSIQPRKDVEASGIALRVEVSDDSGLTVGSGDFSLRFGESRLIRDVVGTLGVPDLQGGEIRVTRTAGKYPFWAVLANVDADGAVSIHGGRAPDDGFRLGYGDEFDEFLASGAGAVGEWDSEMQVSRSASGVRFSRSMTPRQGLCASPGSTSSTLASSLSSCIPPGPTDIFAIEPAEFLVRIFDRENPRRGADLPTIPLSQVRRNAVLGFPFPAGASPRRNLYLTVPEDFGSATVLVELRNADGTLALSRSLSVRSGEHPVISFEHPSAGQVRVVSSEGSGRVWGALASLGSDGSFTITSGANP